MKENEFQTKLKKELQDLFPGSMILKQAGPNTPQGMPDLLILYKDKWASLECKRSSKAHKQPNQDYYVDRMNEMSFSRFVNPENKEEVIRELQRAFEPSREA